MTLDPLWATGKQRSGHRLIGLLQGWDQTKRSLEKDGAGPGGEGKVGERGIASGTNLTASLLPQFENSKVLPCRPTQSLESAQACNQQLGKATFDHRILFPGSTLKVEGSEKPWCRLFTQKLPKPVWQGTTSFLASLSGRQFNPQRRRLIYSTWQQRRP